MAGEGPQDAEDPLEVLLEDKDDVRTRFDGEVTALQIVLAKHFVAPTYLLHMGTAKLDKRHVKRYKSMTLELLALHSKLLFTKTQITSALRNLALAKRDDWGWNEQDCEAFAIDNQKTLHAYNAWLGKALRRSPVPAWLGKALGNAAVCNSKAHDGANVGNNEGEDGAQPVPENLEHALQLDSCPIATRSSLKRYSGEFGAQESSESSEESSESESSASESVERVAADCSAQQETQVVETQPTLSTSAPAASAIEWVVGYRQEFNVAWRIGDGMKPEETTSDIRHAEDAAPTDACVAYWPDGFSAKLPRCTVAFWKARELALKAKRSAQKFSVNKVDYDLHKDHRGKEPQGELWHLFILNSEMAKNKSGKIQLAQLSPLAVGGDEQAIEFLKKLAADFANGLFKYEDRQAEKRLRIVNAMGDDGATMPKQKAKAKACEPAGPSQTLVDANAPAVASTKEKAKKVEACAAAASTRRSRQPNAKHAPLPKKARTGDNFLASDIPVPMEDFWEAAALDLACDLESTSPS